MSAKLASLDAEKREQSGTGSARALRREGKVPAVIYAGGNEPTQVALSANELRQYYMKGRFKSRLLELKIDGKAVNVLPKEVQTHPVNDQIQHVDFIHIEDGKQVRVGVPVEFLNTEKCVGVKRGGVLNIVRHTVEFFCDPKSIPEQIEADILDLNIGESLHINDIELPSGVKPTIDRDFTIATITGRGSADEEEVPTDAPETAEVEATAQKAPEEGKADEKK